MGARIIVPVGTRFGHLVVVKELDHEPYEKRRFLCQCDCGNEKEANLVDLRQGKTTTCGCHSFDERRIDINDYLGKKYGKLTIIGEAKQEKYKPYKVLCRCDCGTIKPVGLKEMTREDKPVFSCGCSRHSHDGIIHRSKERLYGIYYGMKDRCCNPNYLASYNYSGRGITVCDEWKESYPTFRKWALENGYSDGLTLDRRDNDGNYEPSNCRWVDMKVQSNNTRKNVRVTYNGETHTLSEWSEITGIKLGRLYTRYHKGFALDVVFSTKRLATRGHYEKRENEEES